MNWETLLNASRLGPVALTATTTDARSVFDSDVDRIIFSGCFRRLARKTQVHPFAPNDHVHTRLTHSLEVSEVGRALGKALAKQIEKDLPKHISRYDMGAIVQAACLAHDLGNPPFGHAGESAIAHWFESTGAHFLRDLTKTVKRDVASFDGNAQGFRILTQTQNHLFDGGLRLTYATLGAFLKYPWNSRASANGDNFGAFLTEERILEQVAKNTGLVYRKKGHWCRHPLAFLSEAADDICYAIIDLEDGVELNILTFNRVADLLLSVFDSKTKNAITGSFASPESFRVNLARLRSPVFDMLVDAAIEGFMKGYERIMAGTFEGDLFDLLGASDARRSMVTEAKKLASETVYVDQKKVEIEIGCFATLECLLSAFCEAAIDCAQHLNSPEGEVAISWRSKLVLRMLGDHAPSESNAPSGQRWSKHLCLRRILDYVSGMTDNYASYVAKQLQGMGFAGIQRP